MNDFQRGWEVGRNSAMRKNESGCCCKFNEDDEVVELCYAHKIYFEKLLNKDSID